ncbi:MAG: YcbK family protein [Cetobacterium sp.]
MAGVQDGIKDGKYFKVHEFRCKCCGSTAGLQQSIIDLCDSIREEFGSAVLVTSGYRCPRHNKAVGGALKSQHVLGTAADLQPLDRSRLSDLKSTALRLNPEGGVGLYSGFVHVDTRGYKARW